MTAKDKLKTPALLSPGDSVGIISTARKISPQEIQPAVDVFERWGLHVVKGKNLHKSWNQFAGTDHERLSDLQQMLDDPAIKAVVCARGGYGTARIIDRVNFTHFKNKPSWIVGYSDVTALHSHIHSNLKTETIHATMPLNFPVNAMENESLSTLKQALFQGTLKHEIKQVEIFNQAYYTDRTGILTGGNLSMIYSLIGSPSDLDTRGKFLFIEDLDEYLYHVDRMMLNLKRSGKLSGIQALLVGWMNDMNDNTIPFGKTAREIIKEHTADFHFPVIFGVPAGHLEPNLALIFGRKTGIQHEDVLTLTM